MKNILLTLTFTLSIVAVSAQPPWQIGTKWTYEVQTGFGPYINHEFIELEIIDTMTFQGKNIFVLHEESEHFLYVNGDSVYIWDKEMEDFQLIYGFNATQAYETQWTGVCHSTPINDLTLIVDSIDAEYYWDNYLEEYIPVQYISPEEDAGGFPEYKIMQHIGNLRGGLSLQLGYGLCDFDEIVWDLRCYENGDHHINFMDTNGHAPPCDTVWTELISEIDDPSLADISVYPNPFTDQLWLEIPKDKAVRIQIQDLVGGMKFDIPKANGSEVIDTHSWTPGMYIITATEDSRVIYQSKVVLIE